MKHILIKVLIILPIIAVFVALLAPAASAASITESVILNQGDLNFSDNEINPQQLQAIYAQDILVYSNAQINLVFSTNEKLSIRYRFSSGRIGSLISSGSGECVISVPEGVTHIDLVIMYYNFENITPQDFTVTLTHTGDNVPSPVDPSFGGVPAHLFTTVFGVTSSIFLATLGHPLFLFLLAASILPAAIMIFRKLKIALKQ